MGGFGDFVRNQVKDPGQAIQNTVGSARDVAQRYNPYALAQEFRRSPFARGAYSRSAPFLPIPFPGAGLFLQPEQMGIQNAGNQSRVDQSQRVNRLGTGAAGAIGAAILGGPGMMAWIAANPALAAKLGITAAGLAGAMAGRGGGGAAGSGGGGGFPGAQPSTGVVPRGKPTMTGSSYDQLNQYLGRQPGGDLNPRGGVSSPQMAPQPNAPMLQQLMRQIMGGQPPPRPPVAPPTGGASPQMTPEQLNQLMSVIRDWTTGDRLMAPQSSNMPGTRTIPPPRTASMGGYPQPYLGYGP